MAELTQLQMTEMEAILSPDSEQPFENFISNRSEEDKASMLEIMKLRDPESLAIKLSNCLAAPNSDIYTREVCAQLLRNLLTHEDDDDLLTWHRLSVSTQSLIRPILLNCIMLENKSFSVIHELRYAIHRLAMLDNELIPLLFENLILSMCGVLPIVSFFWIFSILASRDAERLVPLVKALHPHFLSTLYNHSPLDNSILLRIDAAEAAIEMIMNIPVSSNEKLRFQELLPGIMGTLTDALSNFNNGESVLVPFIQLAKKDPKFFRCQLRDVVHSMLEIAEDKKLEIGTRHKAIEFVLTLVEAREKAPGMMKKLPLFTHTCFAVLLNLLDVNDEPSAYGDPEVAFGLLCLRRFSDALGGKTVYPVAMEQLGDYLAAPEWEKRHAALNALTQIAKGSSKVMTKYLRQVVDMILRSFQDPYPQVKCAAIRAIGQMSIDFRPVFQEQMHKRVLPALTEAMGDSKNPQVQEHAASAVYHFCAWTKQETLVPYLDKVLNKLLVLLQNDNQMVVKAALTSLGFIGYELEGHYFQKYYDVVVPYVKAILVNVNNKSNHDLLRRALECISLVAVAVGKEKFRDDLKQVMEVLESLLKSQVKELDTIVDILRAYYRICIITRKDFLPYMSVVISPLVECAQLELDKTVPSYKVEKHLQNIKVGDGIMCVRGYDLLRAKSQACSLLGSFALVLEEHFYPWISQAASILIPLLKFYICEKVRERATDAMHKLLYSAQLAVEKGTAQGGNLSYFKQLCGDIIMALGDALYSEPKTAICACILKELNKCLKICISLVNSDQVRVIIDGIKQVIRESSRRKGELTEIAKSEDFDAEEAELLREETELADQVFIYVGDILMTFIETFEASFLPFLDELSSYLMPAMGKDRTTEERNTSLCIFNAVVVNCGEAALKYDIYLPFLLDASNDDSPKLRQRALHGLWLCATYGGYAFKPFIKEALSRINVVITHFNALEPENIWACHNAIGAFGEICRCHHESINSALIIPAWLNCLPIKIPYHDAKIVHYQLCTIVERLDKDILGPNYLHIPKIISVFAEVLCAGDILAREEDRNRMINLLRHFQQTIPPAIWASAWSLLLPQQVMELESLLSPEEDITFEPHSMKLLVL